MGVSAGCAKWFGVFVAWLAFFSALTFGQAISDAVRTQIADVLTEKNNLSTAQKKISSDLLFSAKSSRGEFNGRSFAYAIHRARASADGLVTVDITGSTPEIANRVRQLGGQVVSQYPQYN